VNSNVNITQKSALAIISSNTPSTDELVNIAKEIREEHFGKNVIIHILSNAKSGNCSEDCAFCSQSAHYNSAIPEYDLKSDDELYAEAKYAYEIGAGKFCIVTATRSAFPSLVAELCPTISRIKENFSNLTICLSLGFLNNDEASKLKRAGADRYNHNLETSERYFPSLVSTHTWRERYETLLTARQHGFELCCGGIIGAGETDEDIVDFLFSLKGLDPESVPINFFNPRPGTPLQDAKSISAEKALRVLALARLLLPHTDIRAAGGREKVLGALQKKALQCVTSIFSNGYLTTAGQGFESDLKMIEEIGYRIEKE